MEINGTKYGYTITPSVDGVHAEIHRVADSGTKMYVVDRTFGWLFIPITDKHYEKAKVWAQNQLVQIYKANQQ